MPTREVEPAALAAGERVGAGVELVREADLRGDLVRRPRARVRRAVELDRLAHGEQAVERRLLEHDADPLAERALAAAGVEAEDAHVAGVGAAVAFEDLDERGLAGAVRAEQREHLAAADLEVDAVERLHAVVGLAQAADADGGLGERRRAAASSRLRASS